MVVVFGGISDWCLVGVGDVNELVVVVVVGIVYVFGQGKYMFVGKYCHGFNIVVRWCFG